MPRKFRGVIDPDIRKSQPDWEAFLDTTAPKNAPNVLVLLYDDTGQAAWSPYGGRIEMPTLDRLAKNGLIYTQWRTDDRDRRRGPGRLPLLRGRVPVVTGSSARVGS